MTLLERSKILWHEFLQPLLLVAVIIFPFRSAVADWNLVPTGSMKPTILEGDRIFVNKLAYDLKVPFTTLHLATWGAPARGDIVVLYSPEDGERLVKRVVGLPGDVVSMRDDRLFINGGPLDYGPAAPADVAAHGALDAGTNVVARERLGAHDHPVMFQPQVAAMRDFGPIVVPDGEFFVMGDNRDRSKDSRYIGFVPRARIVGRATAVVVSLDPEHYYMPRSDRYFVALP
jgi:signal peptidase I